MTTKTDRAAADRVLNAACRETIRQIRAGETGYVAHLAAACTAASLLLDPAA